MHKFTFDAIFWNSTLQNLPASSEMKIICSEAFVIFRGSICDKAQKRIQNPYIYLRRNFLLEKLKGESR